MTTLGSCLVSNEPDGLTSALLQARIDGKSWAKIADEFGYKTPSAARSAFQKATGISDFKIKGPELKKLFDAKSGNTLAEKAAKVVIPAPPTTKQVKFINDLIEKTGYELSPEDFSKLDKSSASKLIDKLKAMPNKEANNAGELLVNSGGAYPTKGYVGFGTDGYSEAYAKYVKNLDELINEGDFFSVAHELDLQMKRIGGSPDFNLINKWEVGWGFGETFPIRQAVLNAKTKADLIQDILALDKSAHNVSLLSKTKEALLDIHADVIKTLGNETVSQSAAAVHANATASKVLTKADLKQALNENIVGTPTYEKVVQLTKNGKFYAGIASETGLTIPQIDEHVWQYLLKENDGDVWKAFLEKPTSHEGAKNVVQMVTEASKTGISDEDLLKLTGIDEDTLKLIKTGKFKPAAPGSTTYIPPTQSSSYSSHGGYSDTPVSTGKPASEYSLVERSALDKWKEELGFDLTPAERDAVQNYTGNAYRSINENLRKKGGVPTASDKAIDRSMRPTPIDMKLTRGTGNPFGSVDPSSLVGKVWSDPAFMSTSWGSGNFSGEFILHIDAPKGTLARDVFPLSHHKTEEELLLARGTKFLVNGVERRWPSIHVYMRVVGNGVGP